MTIEPHQPGEAVKRAADRRAAVHRAAQGASAQAAADRAVDDVLSEWVDDLSGQGTGGRRPVWVLSGVNLGRLGVREPDVYGSLTYAQLADRLIALGDQLGLDVDARQTDDEATMIGWLHAAADGRIPVVLNPGAWTHYSIALRDAVSQRTADLVEVHLTNVHAREEFRHRSVISAVATGVIAGLGAAGYEAALRFLAGRC